MATFYLDPVNGNDANDGTTFANRWQTFTSGATAARTAPGDTIRVIASPDPTSIGNATWTNNSYTVTLAGALTANISLANSAWTASANVTSTTNTNRKLGATSSSIAIAAGFTTGKAAYLALGSAIDFSAYQQVSFWINMTGGSMTADGDITLRLCSDTTGDVTVNTISVPRILSTSTWVPVTVDLGTNLGSSIQSIALYVAVDRGAQTFLLNNILACKASSAADSLTLSSLISKNTGNEPFLSIQSINGTTVTLDVSPNYNLSTAATTVGYAGTTETVTTYKREPLILSSAIASGSVFGTINESGTAGNVITYSGGWNRTDMSTQTGDTYIQGQLTTGISMTSLSYLTFDKINLFRFSTAYTLSAASAPMTGITITAKDLANNTTGISLIGSSNTNTCYNNTFTITNIQQTTTNGISEIFSCYFNTFTITNGNMNPGNVFFARGDSQSVINANNICRNETLTITNLINNNVAANVNTTGGAINLQGFADSVIDIGKISGTKGFTFYIVNRSNQSSYNNTITVTNNIAVGGGLGYLMFNEGGDNTIVLTGQTIDLSTSFKLQSNAKLTVIGGNFNASPNPFLLVDGAQAICIGTTTTGATGSGGTTGNGLFYQNYSGSATDHRIYYGNSFGTVLTDTSVRHTASGISWKMTSLNASTVQYAANSISPLKLSVAKIAVNSGSLVTASVWVYRTSTSLTTNFVCPSGQLSGVAPSPVAASAAINTWEQLTMTFTPSMAGVVELFVQCYGAAASVYVDDFEVSQA